MKLRDWTFQRVFANMFVYNILFEDTEVDETFLGVNEQSRILGISAAGCGIANHLSRRPRRIDAVDINKHHLALAALKVSAARTVRSYEEFYDLFGRGFHPHGDAAMTALIKPLPAWVQKHWSERHTSFFDRGVYDFGLTAKLFGLLRKLCGVDTAWLRRLIAMSVEDRYKMIDETMVPVLRWPAVAAVLNSPFNLLALGVNFEQCQKMMAPEHQDLIDFFVMHIKRVAATDLERNWFAWWALAGHYNHDRADAVPPFVRRDHHEKSFGADTDVRFHHKNLFDVLGAAGPRTWTHYTLCDAIDWMPHDVQRRLLSEIHRTSEDGAVVLYRSVENDSLVERHGLHRHLVPMVEESALASQLDRTRQYERVNFYRVVH